MKTPICEIFNACAEPELTILAIFVEAAIIEIFVIIFFLVELINSKRKMKNREISDW